MTFMVFTKGPANPTRATVKMAADVDNYVVELKAKGHTDIRVGSSEADAVPYDDWTPGTGVPRKQKSPPAGEG